ncbi:O-antigen polymerase [Cloacibacillus sp. An23]|uniref:O-antigen polymerase n=1 Tax=Cloacibacillus sp. An23 TaxID=1965591 RepID=UPI002100BCB4|nr:O-antigen polymerase [Cloacibacillus sp. An23]
MFAPPVMMVLVFMACACVPMTRYEDWRLAEYGAQSVLLLILGIISFLSGSLLAYCISHYRYNSILLTRASDIRKRIIITSWGFALMFGLGLVEIFMLADYIRATVVSMNFPHSSLGSMLFSYRVIDVNNLIPKEFAMPSYLRLLRYSVEVFSAFAVYVLLHNFILQCYKKSDMWLVLIILLWPVNSLLVSARGHILNLLAEIVYLIFFFYGVKYGFNFRIAIHVISKGVKLLFVFFILFFVFAIFQGRIHSGNTLFNSATVYAGGGIRAFDLFVKAPKDKNTGMLGNDETLMGIGSFLNMHLGIGKKPLGPLEFRNIAGKNLGNIYTAFRRYYSDFGTFGIVFFSAILGFIMNYMYMKSKNACIKGKTVFEVLLFSWMSRFIFYMPIEEYFYGSTITLSGIYKIVLLYILYRIFSEKKIFINGRGCICSRHH